jgi:hypothetical protein
MVQLASFITANILSWTYYTQIKLLSWFVIQGIFFLVAPIVILVLSAIYGSWQSFATYWAVIDCFLTLTILLHYYKNYTSRLLDSI